MREEIICKRQRESKRERGGIVFFRECKRDSGGRVRERERVIERVRKRERERNRE